MWGQHGQERLLPSDLDDAPAHCKQPCGASGPPLQAELSLIHIIQLSLIHRSSLSLIRMRMRKVLAGPHRTHLGQFGIGRLAT